MKKSNFYSGLISTVLGAALVVLGILRNAQLSGLMCGLGGALLGPGLVQLWKYRKWTRPENAETYRKRLEQEQIDLRDERKNMLRDKAGRYAYVLGLMLSAVSILIFYLLEDLDVVDAFTARLIVAYLGAYLLVQYAAGLLIYRRLSAKY